MLAQDLRELNVINERSLQAGSFQVAIIISKFNTSFVVPLFPLIDR